MNDQNFIIQHGVLTRYIGNDKNITIPEDVIRIGERAFSNNKTLQTLTIGDHVQGIGDEAFSGCDNLWSLTIGKNVSVIGKRAFLINRTIPEICCPDGLLELKHFRDETNESLRSFLIHTVFLNHNRFLKSDVQLCLKEIKYNIYRYKTYFFEDISLPEIRFLEDENLITWKNVDEWIENLQKCGMYCRAFTLFFGRPFR